MFPISPTQGRGQPRVALFLKLFRIAAAGNLLRPDGSGTFSLAFPLGNLEDFVYGFFFRRQNECTCINEDDVPFVRLRSDAIAAFCKERSHDLGVNQILWTSQAYDMDVSTIQREIFLASIFLGLTPSDGPTTPSASMRSIMRAARL